MLHETTQRRVCRVTFLLVCVLPTVLTVGWIAYWHRPWRLDDWQRSLAQQLHVRATVGDIASPRPGVTSLTDVQLADLRSGQPLGSFDELSFKYRKDRLVVQGQHLSVAASQLTALAHTLATWLETEATHPLEIHAEQLTINGPSLRTLQLTDFVAVSVSNTDVQNEYRITAKDSEGKSVQLGLVRNKNTLRLMLDTRQASLPAWLAGELVPGVSSCDDAQFVGVILASGSNQQMQGQLQGELSQIDLPAWLGPDSPHRLQGEARLQLQQLTWQADTIDVAQGTIEADRGSCSYSLLQRARETLGCSAGPAWTMSAETPPDKQIAFDRLSVSFHLSSAGIVLSGHDESNALVSQEQTPLLLAPALTSVPPVSQLVQLLDYRQQPGWLPATRRAHSMAQKLPLPDGASKK